MPDWVDWGRSETTSAGLPMWVILLTLAGVLFVGTFVVFTLIR